MPKSARDIVVCKRSLTVKCTLYTDNYRNIKIIPCNIKVVIDFYIFVDESISLTATQPDPLPPPEIDDVVERDICDVTTDDDANYDRDLQEQVTKITYTGRLYRETKTCPCRLRPHAMKHY